MFEMAGYSKVNQVEVSIRTQHHVRRFEVAEDDGGSMVMEVGQHIAELKTNFQNINQGEAATLSSPGMPFKRYALNEICHEIPAPSF